MPKHICQLYLPCQCEHHGFLRDAEETAICYRAGRSRTGVLAGDGIFANKISVTQNVEGCFFSGS